MAKSCLVSCLINYFNNKQLQVDYPENPAQLPGSFPLSVKKWKGNFYSVSITLFEIIFPPFPCRQRREVRPNISSTTCVVFVILWLFYTSHHISRVGQLLRTALSIWAISLCGYMSTAKDFCPGEQCLFSGQTRVQGGWCPDCLGLAAARTVTVPTLHTRFTKSSLGAPLALSTNSCFSMENTWNIATPSFVITGPSTSSRFKSWPSVY